MGQFSFYKSTSSEKEVRAGLGRGLLLDPAKRYSFGYC